MPAKTKRDDMPRTPGFVYLLHFSQPIGDLDKPHGQAQHYIGCTSDIRTRLIGHAHGRTARIVAAVRKAGLEFDLVTVGVTHRRGMRKIERQIKNWKSARVFCPLCTPDGNQSGRLPGTTPYPVELLPFPTDSRGLRALSGPDAPIVRPVYPEDERVDEQITALMDEEKEALGFVPTGPGGSVQSAIVAGRVLIALIGGRIVGFVWWTETAEEVKIQQVCVQSGFQSQGIGRTFVRFVLTSRKGVCVTCRVRSDLRACSEFWPAEGFFECYREPHKSSGAEIVGFFHPNGSGFDQHRQSKPAIQPEEELPW